MKIGKGGNANFVVEENYYENNMRKKSISDDNKSESVSDYELSNNPIPK